MTHHSHTSHQRVQGRYNIAFSTNRCTARPRRHVPSSFLFRSWEKYPTVELFNLSPIRCASLLVRWGVCVSHHSQNLTQPSGGVTARRPNEPTSDRVSKRRKRTSGTSPPHHWPKEQAVNTNGRRCSKKPNLSRLDQSPPGSKTEGMIIGFPSYRTQNVRLAG